MKLSSNKELAKLLNHDYMVVANLVYRHLFLKCLRDVYIYDYTILSEKDVKKLKEYIISFFLDGCKKSVGEWWVAGLFSLSDDRLEVLARSKLGNYKRYKNDN